MVEPNSNPFFATFQVATDDWVSRSHTLMVWSSDPEARVFPSGENATEVIHKYECSSVPIDVPVSISHSSTWPSPNPEARVAPSREIATE